MPSRSQARPRGLERPPFDIGFFFSAYADRFPGPWPPFQHQIGWGNTQKRRSPTRQVPHRRLASDATSIPTFGCDCETRPSVDRRECITPSPTDRPRQTDARLLHRRTEAAQTQISAIVALLALAPARVELGADGRQGSPPHGSVTSTAGRHSSRQLPCRVLSKCHVLVGQSARRDSYSARILSALPTVRLCSRVGRRLGDSPLPVAAAVRRAARRRRQAWDTVDTAAYAWASCSQQSALHGWTRPTCVGHTSVWGPKECVQCDASPVNLHLSCLS